MQMTQAQHSQMITEVHRNEENCLEDIAKKTNRSRNELINIMLEFGIENCEIIEPESK